MPHHYRAAATAAALLWLALWPVAAWARFDFTASQVSPVPLSTAELAAILDQRATTTPYLDAYGQSVTEQASGRTAGLAPLKVVQTDDPKHPYLGVFHAQVRPDRFAAYAAYSRDLAHWHLLGAIDNFAAGQFASQPDIRILSDDSVLYAEEYHPKGKRPQVRVRHYGAAGGRSGLQRFLANPEIEPTEQKVLPPIDGDSKADGTPEFARIDYRGAIGNSRIEITHHYYNLGRRDIQADGMLDDFRSWSDHPDKARDRLLTAAGGTGKIGDRELFRVGDTVYEIVEAQVHPQSGGDFSSWRLFLVNRTTGTVQQLHPALRGGARSLGNPSVSFVRLPDGTPALVFTCFVFSESRGATPAGGHIYVYRLGD
ncbi:MAG TPA: hypothetical protein VFX06_09480 [Stellaceae bacterium]|nr:hypothetical protein [Stellaceae bacterium]